MLFPNRYSFMDAGQFFDGNSTLSAFGFGNDLLRNTMVYVCGKAGFPTAQAFEFALRTSRTAALQFGTQTTAAVAHVIDLATRHLRSVRGGSDGLDAEIHTQEVIHGLWVWVWNIARRRKVELAAMVDQVGLTLLRFQEFFIPFPRGVADRETAVGGPDAYCIWFEAQDAGVVTDGTMLCKLALLFLVQFVGVGNLGKHPHDHLCAQRKSLTGGVVQQLLQRVLTEGVAVPRLLAGPITAGVCLLNRIEQRLVLACVRVQSYFSSELQYLKYNTAQRLSAHTESLFLPGVNAGASEA